jgi:hypoxanthine phosphoribosyltransferase
MNAFIENISYFIIISSIIITLWFLFYDKSKEKVVFVKEKLTNKETMNGIIRMINYAQHESPDYIVGLNRGGTLVGALISLYLDIPSEKFIRCSIKKNKNIECDINKLNGKVLIVDSVIRTGKTFDIVTKYINDNATNIKKIKSASMVSSIKKNGSHNFNNIDYFAFSTYDSSLLLPWTKKKNFFTEKRSENLQNEFEFSKDRDIQGLVCELFTS